jgi:hypothetical protein
VPWSRVALIFTSRVALIFTCSVSAIGLALWFLDPSTVSPSAYAVPFVWIGGGWYVWARTAESRSRPFLKICKITSGALATMLAPLLLCHSSTDASYLEYVQSYGWHSPTVGDLGRFGFLLLGGLIMIFALADLVDCFLGRRIQRMLRPRGHESR